MKRAKPDKHRRAKAVAVAVAALAAGIGLLVLSRMVIASGRKAAEEAAAAAQTQPAGTTAPATDPLGTPAVADPDPARRTPPADPKAVTAQRLGGLLLLFSLMCFALVVICIGWIVHDIRRSRPAWMTQTKYPVHQRRK
ncbi:MAG TPA: hypothetical protein PL151_13230 [Phycisphaerae bacterium]|nr:hypothetical protein [Phycisphaerae bacterium]HOJ73352.1 hypothetical protein [Phycisphaerae bacterium]HOM50960.1 hypothetical protein [Phycisphaerae bacterium]HON68827.1 hypothetical protein [Phycisphaerae bacterium]HOQ86456.1 hypothetical protein [Phycisphaerae bacterium]